MSSAARARLAFAAAVALSLFATPSVADKREHSVPKGNIRFTVVVENDRGQVACGLFRKNGWLKNPVQPAFSRITAKRRATCVFKDVAAGVYAISAFHDENENKELDTNFLGIPKEDWCTSRNAKAFVGPPSFEEAKFKFNGRDMKMRVVM